MMVIKCFSIILDSVAIGLHFQTGKQSKLFFCLFYGLMCNSFLGYQAMGHISHFALSAL